MKSITVRTLITSLMVALNGAASFAAADLDRNVLRGHSSAIGGPIKMPTLEKLASKRLKFLGRGRKPLIVV